MKILIGLFVLFSISCGNSIRNEFKAAENEAKIQNENLLKSLNEIGIKMDEIDSLSNRVDELDEGFNEKLESLFTIDSTNLDWFKK